MKLWRVRSGHLLQKRHSIFLPNALCELPTILKYLIHKGQKQATLEMDLYPMRARQ